MSRAIKYHVNPGQFDFRPREIPWIRVYPKEVCFLVTFHANCAQTLPHPHDQSWLKIFGLSFGIRGLWNHQQNAVMAAWRWNGSQNKIETTIYAHVNGQTIKGNMGSDAPIDWIDLEQPVLMRLQVDRSQGVFRLITKKEGSSAMTGQIQMREHIDSVYWHSKDLGLWHGGQIPVQAYQEITKQRIKNISEFTQNINQLTNEQL